MIVDHGVVVMVPEHELRGLRHLPHLAGDDTGVSPCHVFLPGAQDDGPGPVDSQPDGESPHSGAGGCLTSQSRVIKSAGENDLSSDKTFSCSPPLDCTNTPENKTFHSTTAYSSIF